MSANNRGRVLLVEAEPAGVKTTEKMLARAGYRVISVPSGRAAFEELEPPGANFTCVIVDLVLPDMSGMQLVTWLRSHHPTIHVVLASCKNGFAASDGVTVLRKPHTIAGLRRAMVVGSAGEKGRLARAVRHK